MAVVVTFATQAGALAWFVLHRTLCGYPNRGTHIGGGVHIAQPDVAPAVSDAPNGWTLRHRRFRRKIATGVYAWVLDPQFRAIATDPAARARLSGAQRTALDNNIATADAAGDDPTWDVVDGTTVDELDP